MESSTIDWVVNKLTPINIRDTEWFPKFTDVELIKIMKVVLEYFDMEWESTERDFMYVIEGKIAVVTYRVTDKPIPSREEVTKSSSNPEIEAEVWRRYFYTAYIVPLKDHKFHGMRLEFTTQNGGHFEQMQLWFNGECVGQEIKIVVDEDVQTRIDYGLYSRPMMSVDTISRSFTDIEFIINTPFITVKYHDSIELNYIANLLIRHSNDKDHCFNTCEIRNITDFYHRANKNVILTDGKECGLIATSKDITPLVKVTNIKVRGNSFWTPREKVLTYNLNGNEFEGYLDFINMFRYDTGIAEPLEVKFSNIFSGEGFIHDYFDNDVF